MEQTWTLLLVDDEVTITRVLARVLAAPGRRIVAVNDPHEALRIVDEEPIDVVISDKDMPEMTGVALLAEVRIRQPLAVRILLTGRATLGSALAAINDGTVFRYLTKPWDEPELLAAVTAALDRREELQQEVVLQQATARRHDAVAEITAVDRSLLEVSDGSVRSGSDGARSSPTGDTIDVWCRALVDRGEAPDAAAVASMVASGNVRAIADALLCIPLDHGGAGVSLAPTDAGTEVALELGRTPRPLLCLPWELGQAIAGRLALLARIDLGAAGEQLGRVRVAIGTDGDAELMVAYQRLDRGTSLELRRLASAAGATRIAPAADFIGRYQILEQLGEGGTGVVYRALDSTLERPVALKMLHGPAVNDPRAVARFLREARATAMARHPSIVEVLDYGQLPDGRPFLVMELVTSPTLESRLEAGPLPLDAALAIARSLAAGLGAAHAVGVIHRDLKPANVFVTDDGHVKIADFGAAKLMGSVDPALTQEGWTVGTPLYMAPEQISIGPVDHRLDLYALGCVVYEMLTGHPPYQADVPLELLYKHLSAPIPDVVGDGGPLPPGLASLVRRMLAKRAADRPQSAGEIEAALAEITRPGNSGGWRRWWRGAQR